MLAGKITMAVAATARKSVPRAYASMHIENLGAFGGRSSSLMAGLKQAHAGGITATSKQEAMTATSSAMSMDDADDPDVFAPYSYSLKAGFTRSVAANDQRSDGALLEMGYSYSLASGFVKLNPAE